MREVSFPSTMRASDATSFAACIATILELRIDDVPVTPPEEQLTGWRTMRWLGGLGLGLIPVADAATFSFAGPWIGWARAGDQRRAVVMFGVPSGLVFDPTGITSEPWQLDGGYVIAALDIALARPVLPEAPTTTGTIEQIYVADRAAAPARAVTEARAIAGLGLEGDRHALGTGTFPSKTPGSAITLIAAEVCESFSPPLGPDEHRRNVITRGIDVERLVGRDFTIGTLRLRGKRICEPCKVIQNYAQRPILRALVHRGGLRADILEDGMLHVGDPVRIAT
ncbi:MAG: hypothetical protein H0V17_30925 [Deltaproteobacteria bacterium]|nr:hypothetical protein [Deltaproteobacteria bacterium]